MSTIVIAETEEDVRARLEALRSVGVPERRIAAMRAGTPEQILARAQALRDVGIEGLTVVMPDAHDLEAVALLGNTLAPVFNPPVRA
jgi:alkanesulfonate monooxygenase SsuD/methylene tetrahydromethanopterin reductase-like flavin-dependent oxidoreductase (luciferase family)